MRRVCEKGKVCGTEERSRSDSVARSRGRFVCVATSWSVSVGTYVRRPVRCCSSASAKAAVLAPHAPHLFLALATTDVRT